MNKPLLKRLAIVTVSSGQKTKTEIMKGKVKDSTQQNYESQLAGSLLSANQASIRGSGYFAAVPCRVEWADGFLFRVM